MVSWRVMEAAFSAQKRVKDKLKLALGSLVYPGQTRRWLRFLNAHPSLAELARLNPRLIHKIYRPYLSNHLNCGERVDLLIGHYGLLFAAGAGQLVESAARAPVTLCTVVGKSAAAYDLQLSAINDGHREGELCLRLVREGMALYSVTFILLRLHGKTYIKIGSLQGIRSEHGALLMKQATRDMHACRPRNLLVSAVRDIGDYFGCVGTLLVSNRNRIALNRRRRRNILSDYDKMWQEMRATRRIDDDFELACSGFQAPCLESVPSNKRSEARKRAALLHGVFDDVRRRLDQLRGAGRGVALRAPAPGFGQPGPAAGLLLPAVTLSE